MTYALSIFFVFAAIVFMYGGLYIVDVAPEFEQYQMLTVLGWLTILMGVMSVVVSAMLLSIKQV